MGRPREFDIDTVLEKAMTVFWSQGYKATSMEDLMKACKLNKQSFYCAFGDKRDLYIKTLERYSEYSMTFVKEELDKSPSALPALRNLFTQMLLPGKEAPRPTGCLMVAASLEFGDTDPEISRVVKASFQRFQRLLAKTIEQGQEQGEITRRFSSELLAKNLISLVGGFRILEKRGESDAELLALLDINLEGMKAA